MGLLPKAKNYTAVVGAVAVVGALLAISQALSRPSGFSIGWALWFVLACTVAQAIVAVGALLLDAGVVTPPAPRPRYDQYAQYGQYGTQPGGYYGQAGGQQHAPFQHHGQQPSPQPSGYGSQYGGYSGPSTGGFGAVGHQQGAQTARSSSLRSKVRPLRRPDSPAMASRRLGLARVLKVTAKATPETRGNRPGPAAEPGPAAGPGPAAAVAVLAIGPTAVLARQFCA
ncbi:putative 34 kDa antigenic protein [Mycobacterium xenopi 3993]|nr:putative 34 kDa antigenic protein [Mycobacterium xenopi 3993]